MRPEIEPYQLDMYACLAGYAAGCRNRDVTQHEARNRSFMSGYQEGMLAIMNQRELLQHKHDRQEVLHLVRQLDPESDGVDTYSDPGTTA